MDPTGQPTTQPMNQLPLEVPPVQLSPEEKRTQQINGAIQTSTSALKMIFSSISKVFSEIFSMILKR